MTKHTPGPWYTRKNDASITALLRNGTASTVAHVDFSKSRDEWVANARLIAAAPDMLAALEMVESLLIGVAMTDYPVITELEKVTAVISKAKGESAE